MNQQNKNQGADTNGMMMSGEFDAKTWFMRIVILIVDLILIAVLFSSLRLAWFAGQHPDILVQCLGIGQMVAAFIITFIRFKGSKLIGVILFLTGLATYILHAAGVL